jgi:flagellar FliL protein
MAQQDTELNLDIDSPKSGKGKLIIFIVAGVVLLAAIAGAVVFFLMGDSEAKKAEEAANAEPVRLEAMYVPIENPITVNILGSKRERMLQVDVQIVVRSPGAKDSVTRHLPLLTNGLLQVFSAANPDTLRKPEGRDELRQKSLEKVQQLMTEQEGAETVEAILFTGFVMQ